jgi:protein-histidine pros-kinase
MAAGAEAPAQPRTRAPLEMAMRLLVKFNLVFVAIFLVGLAASGYVSWTLLQRNAQEEIVQNARLLMEKSLAVRAYTVNQIRPLLEAQLESVFLPQTVPAYSATEVFNGLRKKFPEYSYKEATLNPTNPRNRAVEWEADLVSQFRNSAERVEVIGERETPTGRYLYIARPIKITNGACLACHSTVEAAPRTLLARYGPANGFGWNLNEIVGAQVVSVPMAVPFARATAAFRTFMLSLTAVFVLIGLALNLMLWRMVIAPVARLSRIADQVSMGDMEAPEFPARHRDEIGVLAQSLTRMRKGLQQAMKMLEA